MTSTIREMNIKDLETLSGGTIGACEHDSLFLTDIGAMKEKVGAWDLTIHWGSASSKVDAAWNKLGIRCVSHPATDNAYYINGKAVSRDDALKAAASAKGYSGSLFRYAI